MAHCEIWRRENRTWVRFSAEGERFGEVKDHLKHYFRGFYRYDPAQRAWRIQAPGTDVHRWALRHFSEYEIDLVGAYEHHESRSEQHGRSDQQQSTRAPSRLEQAYSSLFVLPTAPREVVVAAHRALVKMNHPDAGGDTATMAKINDCMDVIREGWNT
jgi:hypothetical protein